MATFYDQFYDLDPLAPPIDDPAEVIYLTVVDSDDNGFIDALGVDTVNGYQVTAVYKGDSMIIDVPGVGEVTYLGVTFYVLLPDGSQEEYFTPTDGQTLASGTIVNSGWIPDSTSMAIGEFGPACFTPGTRIAVPGGQRAIETLKAGDLVMTQDHGPQPVRAVLRRDVCGSGKFAPVRIAENVFGNTRALWVSPQHRMVVSGWRAELLYGAPEVLIAAKHLVDGNLIRIGARPVVSYVHLVLDHHEIIFAEGAATETFHAGEGIMEADRAIRRELIALFPALAAPARAGWETARTVIKGQEARVLAAA